MLRYRAFTGEVEKMASYTTSVQYITVILYCQNIIT